jgi:UDP-N-acetylmuramoylalanine--D-glutamate ligase
MTTGGSEPAALDLDRLDLDAFRDAPVAVLGFARSGIALARFLVDQGARVTIYDLRTPGELSDAIAALGEREVRLLAGPDVDPAAALAGQSLVTCSPSVSSHFPTTESRLRAALGAVEAEGRVPVVSEVDLFLRLCPAPTVGVTGTKGKTTTSSLCGAILAAGSGPSVLGGNIGTPLVERLPELTPDHRVVLELSELQLPTMSRGTTVAVYTHVTQDHLDRHGTVEAYRAVKRTLAERVDRGGALVLNAEDPVSGAYAGLGTARTVMYRRDRPMRGGVGVVDGWIVADEVARLTLAGGGTAATGPGGRVLPVAEIPLAGEHNVGNVLAAVGVGLLFGIAPDAIRAAVASFRAVEHRLEPVAEIDGVLFVNDSQGTQPDAVIAALRSYAPPIILIAGGRHKGVPLDGLAREAAARAAAVVLIGESAPLLEAELRAAGHAQIVRADTLEDAVARADALARLALATVPARRATVLLSPAAASFDMFVDYAARGRAFKSAVASLAVARAAREHGR